MKKEDIQKVREISGMGIQDSKEALLRSNGDVFLAAGYLHYQSLALKVKDRKEWEERNAKVYADKLRIGESQ